MPVVRVRPAAWKYTAGGTSRHREVGGGQLLGSKLGSSFTQLLRTGLAAGAGPGVL